MSYELRAGETFGDGVLRVCCEQIKGAIVASRARPQDGVSPVHATRRHLKKARAALRLMSRHVRSKDFKREHRHLRDVGRLISEVRDAEVRLGTVRHLRAQSRMQDDPALAATEDLLSFELDNFFAACSDWQKEAQATLTGVRKRMAQWHLVHLDCKQIRCVVQRTYRRGRQTLAVATGKPTADNFHEFRKQVKELSFHLRILRPLHPPTFAPLSEELKTLGEHLGQANDLAFLEDRLVALHDHQGSRESLQKLSVLIKRRAKNLQAAARDLGGKFYAKPAKEFGQQIARHFETWHEANPATGRSKH
ncbi:MAG: CHAD domain-containing protein [Chthoniobacterales bacterium]